MASTSQLKRGFLACHKLLVQRIEPTGLMIDLIPKGIISTLERDIISEEVVPGLMTDKLLTLIHKKAVFDPNVYDVFLSTMDEEGTLIDVSEEVRAKAGDGDSYLWFAILKAHEDTIVAGMSVEDILPELVSSGVVSSEENENIREGESSAEQAKRLLKVVRLRGSPGFLKFRDALLNSESQQQLGSLLYEFPYDG